MGPKLERYERETKGVSKTGRRREEKYIRDNAGSLDSWRFNSL